ncbi:MAG: phosphoglycerate mutase [Xanthomonadales bacterium]|nr:phosphoglycerate mutase [Xanthomonadales bacterium]
MSARVIVLAPAQPADARQAQELGRLLARADHQAHSQADGDSLYGDLFPIPGQTLPAAALSRQADAGDAGRHAWLRADPALFRLEPGSVRLMRCGDLDQNPDEVRQLLASLAPLFGDEGFELSAPQPQRWYLRPFATGAEPDLPSLPPPDQALGGDLFELWPEDDLHRRWRVMFGQVQITLAAHPVNQARAAAGKSPINGVWFWGAGRHPGHIQAGVDTVVSNDHLLRALAEAAKARCLESAAALAAAAGPPPSGQPDDAGPPMHSLLLDLRHPDSVGSGLDWLLQRWQAGGLNSLEWRSPSGRWQLKRWHRWRVWRRA